MLVLLIVEWEKMLIIIKAAMNSSSILWGENFSKPEKPFSIRDRMAPAGKGIYNLP